MGGDGTCVAIINAWRTYRASVYEYVYRAISSDIKAAFLCAVWQTKAAKPTTTIVAGVWVKNNMGSAIKIDIKLLKLIFNLVPF